MAGATSGMAHVHRHLPNTLRTPAVLMHLPHACAAQVHLLCTAWPRWPLLKLPIPRTGRELELSTVEVPPTGLSADQVAAGAAGVPAKRVRTTRTGCERGAGSTCHQHVHEALWPIQHGCHGLPVGVDHGNAAGDVALHRDTIAASSGTPYTPGYSGAALI